MHPEKIPRATSDHLVGNPLSMLDQTPAPCPLPRDRPSLPLVHPARSRARSSIRPLPIQCAPALHHPLVSSAVCPFPAPPSDSSRGNFFRARANTHRHHPCCDSPKNTNACPDPCAEFPASQHASTARGGSAPHASTLLDRSIPQFSLGPPAPLSFSLARRMKAQQSISANSARAPQIDESPPPFQARHSQSKSFRRPSPVR